MGCAVAACAWAGLVCTLPPCNAAGANFETRVPTIGAALLCAAGAIGLTDAACAALPTGRGCLRHTAPTMTPHHLHAASKANVPITAANPH